MALSKQKTALSRDLKKENTEDVDIYSFNQIRPDIRQIHGTIGDITKHVITCNDSINIYPTLSSNAEHCAQKDFHERLFKEKYGLAYITENLSVSANVCANTKPEECIFDVCLILEDSPITVITVVSDENIDALSVKRYNRTLARGMIDSVRDFTTEQFTVLYGVMSESQIADDNSFTTALNRIRKQCSRLCLPDALEMSLDKCKILTQAFLSSVAITASVCNSEANRDTLWFLTLEQFDILTENIDKREVTVRTAPSSGGKVLMREIARRLERSGSTLLVTETEEEIQVARLERSGSTSLFMQTEKEIQVAREKKICSFMMTVNEWRSRLAKKEDLEGLTNMVTNCQDCPSPPGITGRSWTFVADVDVAQDLKIAVTNITECTPTNRIQVPTQENPLETIVLLRNELKNKEIMYTKLENENEKLKQTEEKLNRMLDKVSLGGRSLDSDYGSDTSSMASFGGLSVSSVDIRTDPKGATGGQGGATKLLKRMKKTLTFGRSKTEHTNSNFHTEELGAVPEEGQKLPTSDPLLPIYVTAEGPLYVLTGKWSRKPVYLLCAQHEMDKERANTEYCHMTEDRQLVNTELSSLIQQGSRRFKVYKGTCTTSPIHRPPSASSLTPVPPAPQYWETETAVEVTRGLYEWWHVMEIGVVEEDRMDRDWWVYSKPRSWCVTLGGCDTHKGYCTQVWNQRYHVQCVRDPMSNTTGTSYTLRYGVVVDIVRGRVGFVDVDKGIVLEKMDVEFTQTIYPVFGVCPYPDFFTVEMRLISGSDVTMTEDKQKLIHSCLT